MAPWSFAIVSRPSRRKRRASCSSSTARAYAASSLDPYGVFFDVEVPSLNATLTWSLKTLQESDSGVQTALNTLRNRLDHRRGIAAGAAACRRARDFAGRTDHGEESTRTVTPRCRTHDDPRRTPATATCRRRRSRRPPRRRPSRTTSSKTRTRRIATKSSKHCRMRCSTTAARCRQRQRMADDRRPRHQDRPVGRPQRRQTVMIRIHGVDLSAYRARQITREEVLKRIERRVF